MLADVPREITICFNQFDMRVCRLEISPSYKISSQNDAKLCTVEIKLN